MSDRLPDAALLHQCLYLVESFPWNNGRMCSYCVILFMLTGVFVAGRRKCIAGVGFLPQGISCVFFVGEDVSDRGTVPFFSLAAGNAFLVQLFCDCNSINTVEVPLKDAADHQCGVSIDFYFPANKFVAVGHGRGKESPCFHPALTAPSHIAGDGFALLLGEGGVDGGDELAAHIGGIDALAFEADIDTQLLQLPHRLQTVLGVPGEAGDGFNEDLVDEPPAAVRHHALEILPLCGGGAGDALVGVDIHHAPFSLAGDQLGVVAVLRREGVELVIGVRADTSIGRYPQLRIPRLLRRLNLDDAGLRCQCHCAVCQMLFCHACSPPVLATQTLPQPCSESY